MFFFCFFFHSLMARGNSWHCCSGRHKPGHEVSSCWGAAPNERGACSSRKGCCRPPAVCARVLCPRSRVQQYCVHHHISPNPGYSNVHSPWIYTSRRPLQGQPAPGPGSGFYKGFKGKIVVNFSIEPKKWGSLRATISKQSRGLYVSENLRVGLRGCCSSVWTCLRYACTRITVVTTVNAIKPVGVLK